MDSPSSSSSTTTAFIKSEEGSEPPHGALDQTKLCNSFMEVGSLLYCLCPELFSNALSQLSNQLSLSIAKNPGMLRGPSSAVTLATHGKNKRCCDDDCGAACSKAMEKGKHVPFRKYVLPKDAPPEYYQCMDCGERRTENSFQNDHTHFGKKPRVRWFCPICQLFFAVTHRSGHIKCKHPCSEASSPASSPLSCPSPDAEIGRKRMDHSEVVISSGSSSPQQDFLVAEKATIIRGSSNTDDRCEEREEAFEAPARKRLCLRDEQTNDCQSSQLIDEYVDELAAATTTTSQPEREEASEPIVRVPSTPSFPSACYSDDLVPAFRCPSYVLMPSGDNNCIDPDCSGYGLFM